MVQLVVLHLRSVSNEQIKMTQVSTSYTYRSNLLHPTKVPFGFSMASGHYDPVGRHLEVRMKCVWIDGWLELCTYTGDITQMQIQTVCQDVHNFCGNKSMY